MRRFFTLLPLTMVAGSANAADEVMYLYAAVGKSTMARRAKVDTAIPDLCITASSSSADETDTAWNVQSGWGSSQNFAVEGGYVNLGTLPHQTASTESKVGARDGNVMADWNLGLIGILPVS